MKTVNVKDNLFVIYFFPFLRQEPLEKIENDDISIAIKTEKISGNLMIHIPLTPMF